MCFGLVSCLYFVLKKSPLFLLYYLQSDLCTGVSVVTVLDNTVGGFLNLSVQRLMGTLIGGAASIIVMTLTRACFHPNWDWPAAVVLCVLMFIQVFFIAKLKVIPKYAYAGSIVCVLIFFF